MGIIMLPVARIAWEEVVCADYIADKIDLDQLEAELELVVAGDLPDRLKMGGLPFSSGMTTAGELR